LAQVGLRKEKTSLTKWFHFLAQVGLRKEKTSLTKGRTRMKTRQVVCSVIAGLITCILGGFFLALVAIPEGTIEQSKAWPWICLGLSILLALLVVLVKMATGDSWRQYSRYFF